MILRKGEVPPDPARRNFESRRLSDAGGLTQFQGAGFMGRPAMVYTTAQPLPGVPVSAPALTALLLAATTLTAGDDVPCLEVGVAWEGASAMPERVLAGLQEAAEVFHHLGLEVRTELKDGQRATKGQEVTVIIEGLKPGETVVVDGQLRLYPDAKLDIKKP